MGMEPLLRRAARPDLGARRLQRTAFGDAPFRPREKRKIANARAPADGILEGLTR